MAANTGLTRQHEAGFLDERLEDLARHLAPARIEDVYPLSPLQEGMDLESVASEAPDLYLLQQRIEIEGNLDINSFEAAWILVFNRHPALRTGMTWVSDQPMQVVAAGMKLPFELLDLADVEDAETSIASIARDDRLAGFDLAKPPLIRLTLIRIADDHHQLLWTHHHSILDGWSAGNVLGEVFTAYQALSDGLRPDLPDVPSYRTFVDWLETRDRGSDSEFWAEELSGLPGPTRMTEGVVSDLAPSSEEVTRDLSPDLGEELTALARDLRIGMHALLAGVVAVVTGRHQAMDDITLAIVTAGRPPTLPGVESMVGLFINTVPLRVTIDPQDSFADLLQNVHQAQARLIENDTSSLSDVQRWADVDRIEPLTDTLFAYADFTTSGRSGDLHTALLKGVGVPVSH